MQAGAIAIAALLVVGCSGEVSVEDGDGLDGAAPADCLAFLDQNAVSYQPGPEMPGVSNPVTVTPPIGGIVHRALGAGEPRASFFMDCQLAAALVRGAPLLAERDVIEVRDLGVYNYRCIGEGTPPDCPNGMSQHAYALAIDIAGFVTADGTSYSVLDDWVIDPDGEETCAAAAEGGDKDAFLHDLVCAQKTAGIWNIVLTPNYNTDHRNHFHVDLTADGDFIERGASAGEAGACPTTWLGGARH